MSDQHNPKAMGCAGHPDVVTPNLDGLAKRGKRFLNAICASPICVPARAALATGRNIFETGYWDNVDAYDGEATAWHHVLRDAGHKVVSIGKLHYRGWAGDDYGFTESLLPMHIHGGKGEPKMLLRNPPADIGDGSNLLNSAGPGVSTYSRYDESIIESAVQWLDQHRASVDGSKPWVLMVSLVAPHFPLTVPEDYFGLYSKRRLSMPKSYHYGIDPGAHPFDRQYAAASKYNLHFKSEADVQRALAAYYGLITYLDHQVGRLLSALDSAGLSNDTRVLYLSDHGDNAGARGLWGKSTMYAESVGVPMILSGPDIEAGSRERAAVSHTDVYNTVLDAVGIPLTASTASSRSSSLLRPLTPDRIVLSEYHTIGSRSAVYMLQNQHYKYVHHCDLPAQIFDLVRDPEELNDIAAQEAEQSRRNSWESRLRMLCNPEEVDARAKARQQELIELFGGEAAIRQGTSIGGYTPAPPTREGAIGDVRMGSHRPCRAHTAAPAAHGRT